MHFTLERFSLLYHSNWRLWQVYTANRNQHKNYLHWISRALILHTLRRSPLTHSHRHQKWCVCEFVCMFLLVFKMKVNQSVYTVIVWLAVFFSVYFVILHLFRSLSLLHLFVHSPQIHSLTWMKNILINFSEFKPLNSTKSNSHRCKKPFVCYSSVSKMHFTILDPVNIDSKHWLIFQFRMKNQLFLPQKSTVAIA